MLKVTNPNLELSDIINGEFSFESPESLGIENIEIGSVYWIKVDFINELDTLATKKLWRLRTFHYPEVTLYYLEKDRVAQKSFGQFEAQEKRTSLKYFPGVPFEKENLIDGRYLYLRARTFYTYPKISAVHYLSDESNRFFTHYYTLQDLDKMTLSIAYAGACFIIFLTFLIIYFFIRRFEFLFYALYAIFSAIYLVSTNLNIFGLPQFLDTPLGFWSLTISQVLINLFYVLFSMYYLDTKKEYPKLHSIMKLIVIVLTILIISGGITYMFGFYKFYEGVLDFQRLIMTLFGLFSMLYLLFKAKDKLAIFIVVGSFIYMVGALLYMFTFSKFYMIVGTSLEIIIFSLGLAYKIKMEYSEKMALQKEVTLKEISALRAQMNPHFIFNSLNSIQHLILNNDKLSALKYLSRFGKLTRSVLESSYETIVTLKEEIKLLQAYLELESLRFNGKIKYSINVEDGLETDNIEIPLMLLQPFAENAIVHGLLGKKEGDKSLDISFKREENNLICEIDDNGIGRKASNESKSITKEKIQSRGMEITKKRLEMLTKSSSTKGTIDIVDKYNNNGNPKGTKVRIRIHEILN